jgi:RNA polymerase sigma-70 factor (ECF subfamily)
LVEAWLFRAVRNGAINAGIASHAGNDTKPGRGQGPAWFETDRWAAESPQIPTSPSRPLAALPLEQREVIVAHLGALSEQIAETRRNLRSSAHHLITRA